jgi:hypothetical protein
MEFLILAILGLTTAGVTKAFSSPEEAEEEDKDKKAGKEDKGAKNGKGGKNGKDDKEEEPKKTPRQKLMEAIAEYESEVHEGEKVKIHLEIEDR